MADVVTTAGKAAVVERMGGLASTAAFTYLALGTLGTTAVEADTALGAEIVDSGLERALITPTNTTSNILEFVNTWTASGTKILRECGVFNHASAGTMLAHSDFSDITVDAGDSIQITYRVTVS